VVIKIGGEMRQVKGNIFNGDSYKAILHGQSTSDS